MITVWGRRNSLNVQKVMWAIGELALPYIRHDVAGSFGVDDNYRKLNPNAVVPTIQDEALTLYESNACVRHLARKYGEDGLQPSASVEIALADQWMEWQSTTLSPMFFLIFSNQIRVPEEKKDKAKLQQGIAACAKLFVQLDKHLSQSAYLAGEQFSMGDIPIGAHLYRYFEMDIERPSVPNVERWYAQLQTRPAYRKHVMIPFGRNVDEWLVEEKNNAGIQ